MDKKKMFCSVCKRSSENLYTEHKNPLLPLYCGEECQLIGSPALSTAFRQQPFYINSAKLIRYFKDMDIFAYLCISHYGFNPTVNKLMFALNGDWTKVTTQMHILGFTSDIWTSVFKQLLEMAPSKTPFTDRSGKIAIRTREQLLYYYSDMRKYLQMTDLGLFLRFYMSSLHSAILKGANTKGQRSVQAWRGYKPLPIPNSLSMNPMSYKPGSVITNWGVTSISLQSNISAGFAGLDQACCMMLITVPANFPIFLLSSDDTDTQYPSLPTPFREMEILLPAGTQFKIGKHLGKLPYKPYNKPGQTVYLDTVKVKAFATSHINGYIGYKQRYAWSKTV